MAADHYSLSSLVGLEAHEKDEKALQFIEAVTRNADLVQDKVLAEILSTNKEVEYIKRFQLHGAIDRETFKLKIPMITHQDIQPEIQRIANGDRSPILSAHPISQFYTSSGTTAGERKLIPATEEHLVHGHLFNSLMTPLPKLYVPGLDKGKRAHFLFSKSQTKTPGGFLARSALTSYYNSDHFKNRPHDPYNFYTSPNEAILCEDFFQSIYTQILCALFDYELVLRVGATFPSSLLSAIRFLQLHWEELARDIEVGKLNNQITDPAIKDCMEKILKPRPKVAEHVRMECFKENWEGIIKRIWPNTKFLDVIITGAMAQYIPTLDYYSGGLPLVSAVYASSECYFGLNLTPMCNPLEVSYTIVPNMAYFEFLPYEPNEVTPDDSPPKLVDLVDVEVGKEYELVLTTNAGLYRYRVGDILRVTGFHNSAPQFHFVRRKNVLLSIDADKTDEAELHKAINDASQLLHKFNSSVVEYTSCADTKTIPGHYVIYWELLVKDSVNSPTDEVLSQCCLAIEESLNSVYRQGRVANNSIGPLEIRVVKNGTFQNLMEYAVLKGTSISQYKVSRCVNSTPIVELLDSAVVSAHFSPSLPHWIPDRKW